MALVPLLGYQRRIFEALSRLIKAKNLAFTVEMLVFLQV